MTIVIRIIFFKYQHLHYKLTMPQLKALYTKHFNNNSNFNSKMKCRNPICILAIKICLLVLRTVVYEYEDECLQMKTDDTSNYDLGTSRW